MLRFRHSSFWRRRFRFSVRECESFARIETMFADLTFSQLLRSQSLLTPRDRPNILWRVENHLDIVTRLPLGIADNEAARSTLSSISPLNYSHVGSCLVLRPLFPLFASYRPSWKVSGLRAFHAAVDIVVTDEDYEGEAQRISGERIRNRSLRTDWMGVRRSRIATKAVRATNHSKWSARNVGIKVTKFVKSAFSPFYDHCG